MTEDIEDALVRLARGAGDALIMLEPEDEHHFDPFTVTLAFTGMLLASFLKGFTTELTGGAEARGRELAQAVSRTTRELFARPREPDLEAIADELAAARAASQRTEPGERRRSIDALRAQVVEALLANGLPPDRAVDLAMRIADETLALIDATGA